MGITGNKMKRFKVVFISDKREEIIIEADQWEIENNGEISFLSFKDGDFVYVALVRNVVVVKELKDGE